MNQPWISSAAIVSLLLALIANVHSFNLENRLPIYKFDDDSTSYFGYSVALHRERSNNMTWWVIFLVCLRNCKSQSEVHSERVIQMPDNNNLYCVRETRQMAPEFLIKILLITAQNRCFSCPFIPWAIIADRIEHREFSEWTSNNNIIASALPVSPKKSGFLRRLTLSVSVLAHSQFFTFFFVDSIENVCGVWKKM